MSRSRRGFSLLELNVVVTLIAILASIAAPAYAVYLRRGQAVEAMTNVQTIGYLEEVHILETARALACGATPDQVPHAALARFDSDGCWSDLGVHMEARVRFQYLVEAPTPKSYRVTARGDLDGDAVESVYAFDSQTMALSIQNAGE